MPLSCRNETAGRSTFDATQGQPRGGRIVVAYGRDIADVAFLSNDGPMQVSGMKVSVEGK